MGENNKEGNNNDYQEWEKARELIDKFEEKIYELRKYAFTFITTLIAAQSILTPPNSANIVTEVTTNSTTTTTTSALPDTVKFAAIFVTLVLIVAVALFEKDIFIRQRAVLQRAIVLERRLNIEISEITNYQYTQNKGKWYKFVLYGFFIFGTFILSISVTDNIGISILFLVLFIIILTAITLDFKFQRVRDYEDWSLDKLECQKGGLVGITLTNFGEKEKIFNVNDTAWEVEKENGQDTASKSYQKKIKEEITIKPEQSYTWFWNTKKCDAGIYKIYPNGKYNKDEKKIKNSLNRRFRILEKTSQDQNKKTN